jgi:uncharacterized protein YjbI with pentapeptide repeats
MAEAEHINILKQGVDTWNRWRREHLEIRPDLKRANLIATYLRIANLSKADLSYADLNDSDLTGANLSDANLYSADLSGVNLNGVNLSEANLESADLRVTTLHGAYLHSSNLRAADLRFANLIGANFHEADLSTARLGWTTFGNQDLGSIKGLETVQHLGPSTIGIDTIYLSKGELPEHFLRGAGIPEVFITYLSSLTKKPIHFYSCFISYSTKDQQFANRLYADLQIEGIRCWFAPEDLKIGENFRQRIDESIRLHDKLLLILSEQSIASPWVEDEVAAALEREHKENRLVLFPISIDDAVWDSKRAWAASLRRMRHVGGFKDWKHHDGYKKAFNRLLRDLKAE